MNPLWKTHNVVGVMEISAPDLPLCWCRLANGVLSDSELITLQQGVSFSDGQVRPLTPCKVDITPLFTHAPETGISEVGFRCLTRCVVRLTLNTLLQPS